jgi:hypothetical protein
MEILPSERMSGEPLGEIGTRGKDSHKEEVQIQTEDKPRPSLQTPDLVSLRKQSKKISKIWPREKEVHAYKSLLEEIAKTAGINIEVLDDLIQIKSAGMAISLLREMESKTSLSKASYALLLNRMDLTPEQCSRVDEACGKWNEAVKGLALFKEKHGLPERIKYDRYADHPYSIEDQAAETVVLIHNKIKKPDETDFNELRRLLFETEKSMGKAAKVLLEISREAEIDIGTHQDALEVLERDFSHS